MLPRRGRSYPGPCTLSLASLCQKYSRDIEGSVKKQPHFPFVHSRQWSEEQRARIQLSTTSIEANSNWSTKDREPSSSTDTFLFNWGTSKSLLKRLALDARIHPATVARSAQYVKPFATSLGRKATTMLCADQPSPLGWLQPTRMTCSLPPDNPWVVIMSINDSPVKFKIDTGTDVSVISDSTYKALARKTSLRSAKKSLTGQAPTSGWMWAINRHSPAWILHIQWGYICGEQPADVCVGLPSHWIAEISL